MKTETGAPEHRGDTIDQASAQEEAFRTLAIASCASRAGREVHPEFDGEHCLDCGNEVGTERLKLGRIRCVGCQTALEKRTKMKGY